MQFFGLNTLSQLIFNPLKGWQSLMDKKDEKHALWRFAYVFIALSVVCAIIGSCIFKEKVSAADLFNTATLITVALFSSLYIAAFLIKLLYELLLKMPISSKETVVFSAYSYACVYLIYMFAPLFHDVFYIHVLSIYTLYIVWEGTNTFLPIKSDKRSYFVFIATLIIIFLPYFTKQVIYLIMPGII